MKKIILLILIAHSMNSILCHLLRKKACFLRRLKHKIHRRKRYGRCHGYGRGYGYGGCGGYEYGKRHLRRRRCHGKCNRRYKSYSDSNEYDDYHHNRHGPCRRCDNYGSCKGCRR